MEMNVYKNKYFSILGDSISTLEGYSEPVDAAYYAGTKKFEANIFLPSDTWWGQVIEHLEGRLLVNNSFSGSTVSKHPSCLIESYGCSDTRLSSLSRDGVCPDVIFVYMGTNDWGWGMKPYSLQCNDLSVFSVAYRKMIDGLKRYYPKAKIFCFTLFVNDEKANTDFFSYGKYPILDYCDWIRQIARDTQCRVIDLQARMSSYYSIDGFHPNSEGMKAFAKAAIKEIEQ